jgi:poly(A) polymerase
LPDYVFGEGGRQTRPQKRPKTGKVRLTSGRMSCTTSLNHFMKGSGRSENPSPEQPNKKRRLVLFPLIYSSLHRYTFNRPSYMTSESASEQSSETLAPPVTNGTISNGTQDPSITSSNTAGIYTSAVKDPSEIRSPQLPLGENVAIATNSAAAAAATAS